MATRRSYIYLAGADGDNSSNTSHTTDHQFHFDESELWSSSEILNPEKNPIPSSRPVKKPVRKIAGVGDRLPKASSSLPVNIPDWSKILRDEYGKTCIREGEDGGDDSGDNEDEDGRLPPHEYLARTRMASFSVHEGVGRTLKGRDLSRVRNAIWKQTGFED